MNYLAIAIIVTAAITAITVLHLKRMVLDFEDRKMEWSDNDTLSQTLIDGLSKIDELKKRVDHVSIRLGLKL